MIEVAQRGQVAHKKSGKVRNFTVYSDGKWNVHGTDNYMVSEAKVLKNWAIVE